MMNRILIRYIGFSLVAAVLMLAGSTVFGQNDRPYVIKIKDQDNNDHYLAHVNNETQWVVTDATEFSPNCIWYSGIEQNISGTNHNYYFDDGANLRFLSAPMSPNGSLGLSDNLPATYLLSNTDTIYYFYDWDSDNTGNGGGVARGHQYFGYNQQQCVDCQSSWYGNECWRVYWIAYSGGWKLTSKSYYDIDDIVPAEDGVGGRFRLVTVEDIQSTMSGGLADLSGFEMNYNVNHPLAASVTLPYTYISYTHYSFEENGTSHHYYYDNADHNAAPTQANGSSNLVASYEWTLSGPGAAFLSFASGSMVDIINTSTPTLYYRVENTHGDTQATLKLKVTYDNGTTQETSAQVTVKTRCQNPEKLEGTPIVNYEDVLVEWYDIADSYKVYWRKVTNPESTWSYSSVVTDNFYAFVGLEPDKQYEYKVHAFCGGDEVTEPEHVYTFTTHDEHELLVYGAIFGGGRMANVTGNTEVVVVNCDSIGAIYGGNDIAGEVLGDEGSTITLGNNSGTGAAITSSPVKVGSVYGGGNGYYAYNQPSGSVSFTPIQAENTSVTVAPGHRVIGYNVLENQWANVVWTNTGTSAVTLTVPSITKTAINVVNDYVKVDTIFGGAKNAFIKANNGNGSAIAIDGGTIVSVFGGNNVGGSQGTGKHYIKVDEAEKTETANYLTRIHTLFGGGNKVAGSETDILVNGGMIDTLYAGGNSADVAGAKVKVDCDLGAKSSANDYTFGKTYTQAINPENYTTGSIGDNTILSSYPWNGTGVYNITALFGGNNQADMHVIPTITLTSGSVGTVYGGGNAGDMKGGVEEPGRIADDFGHLVFERTISNPADNETIVRQYSTYVELASPKMIIDYLYGGCQMSNVYYSSWIEMSDGHVGTVYGGCNISGDVGSRYLLEKGDPLLIEEGVSPDGTAYDLRPKHEKYQAVKGGTFVKVSGGHIYKDLFAGSNGRYHCNNGKVYVSGIDFDNLDTEGRYIGLPVPSHNETHVYVSNGEVDGNVYAGGNLACVGFINETVPLAFYTPVFVGMATVRMSGGHVHGSVFGGGNMASIWGSNAVSVQGGRIDGALYGGNDRIGLVAQITNRVLPSDYGKASDNYTSLEDVRTYIGITGRPVVNTVYGGGNGDYDYSIGQYCNPNDQPVQSNTFVDVNIDGYADGLLQPGHIHTVYGGGNGVTVTGTTTVFLNVKGDPNNQGAVAQGDHVDFIFGGNNKGPLAILPDIILLKGNVNTVYGGCNQGAMIGNHSVDNTYHNISSLVRLRSSYPSVTGVPTAKVTGAVFGGCRMNGVTNNSLVLVEGGQHPASMFGGSDISGTIGGTSQVVVTGGQTGNVYGGGNGNYDYDGTNVYVAGSSHTPENLVASGEDDITAPVCNASVVNILGGQVGASGNGNARNVYGGGYGHLTSTTGNVIVTIGNSNAASLEATPTLFGDVYGGSALGVVNSSSTDMTNVNFFNGTIHGNVYGGGHGFAETNAYGYLNPNPTNPAIPAVVNGTVYVNIGFTELDDGLSQFVNIDGKVFGGNNLAGSPQGNVNVDVYRTAHTTDNTCPGTVPTPFPDDASHYALSEVYGGGNLAHYEPTDENASTNVHIHNCENTIRYVYGGGNAANVPAANVTIDGGLVEYVFGGGNGAGTGNPGANVNGNNTIALNGGMMGYVFGGSNSKGYVVGTTDLQFATSPSCTRSVNELYGGGNQAADENGITLNVPCGTADVKTIYGGARNADVGTSEQPADIVLNVNGGDRNLAAVFGGNNVGGTIYGNVTLNLYGGTIDKAFGGNNAGGDIKGAIQVNMEDRGGDCPLGINTIYGGGNEAAYTPANASASPEVNIIHGTVNNAVYGGGKGVAATVTANPRVVIGDNDASHKAIVGATLNGSSTEGEGYVFGGGDAAAVVGTTTVIYQDGHADSQVKKIFGGGNNIAANNQGVTNAVVQINNGHVTTGIYGGCNTDGDVTGDVTVSLTNGTIGALGNAANIHGGGYGHLTTVGGDVTVSFGANDNSPTGLILYGDLYGGSALGSVNTNASNTTTVNVYNGTIERPVADGYANVFGGGLGDAGHPAMVYGVVHVNIGSETGGGNATLTHCNVFGCNNQNGSPQDDVFVNVYQTAHTLTDAADYFDNDRTYAIYQVFGGGNEADYRPENNLTTSSKKTHVTVHGCENTVQYVYGGSNAAYAVGVVNIILGGRFEEVYGGGNGRVHPADIGLGGIGLNVVAGNVSYLFEVSNKNGTNYGPFYKPDASSNCLGGLFVDSYFFGTNEAELYGDLNNIITCAEAGNFEYRNVFAGSRWGIVYGDITLTVCGGIIENLFGGCRGYSDYSADVRRFPTFDEIDADIAAHPDNPADRKYTQDLLTHMGYPDGPQPSYAGHGGNIHLIVNGGTIGNVFGGCDIKGNVEGKISVTVCDVENASCPLFVGNVYGASNMWYHNPEHSDINSPEVRILKGTVGGSHPDLPVNNIYGAVATDYEGNVFGGGNHGDVKANPRVIVGDGTTGTTATRVTIKGDVYGGGNEGNVTGSPNVIVVPTRHTLTFSAQTGGAVTIYNGQGSTVTSGSLVGEGVDVQLIARPADYAHKFTGWTVNGAGASLSDPNAASTVLTMGTADVTVTANFTTVTTHTLTFNTSPTGGTFTVTGANGSVSSGSAVGEGVVLNLVATASPYGYKFKQWTVTGAGASVANDNATSTTFTMGTAEASIVAVFEEVSHYALTITPASDGSFTVKDYQDHPVSDGTQIGVGATLYLVASPASGFAFSGWTVMGEGASVANKDALETTFTMGTEASSITASFAPVHILTIASPANGLIRVMDALGHTVNNDASIGEGAILNIKAMPHSGYAFKNWTVSEGSSVLNANVPITSFTMGSSNATIGAVFVTAHILTIIKPDEMVGTVKVTNPDLNQNVSSPASIGEEDVLNLVATPATGYHFVRWNLEGGGTLENATEASTTFTMGTVDSTITAVFEHN